MLLDIYLYLVIGIHIINTMSEHEWPEESLSTFTKLLSKDNIVKNLATEFNLHAPHFRLNKIAEITNSERLQTLDYIAALSSVVHFYMSHNSEFEKKLTTTFNSIQDKLRLFTSSLDENGKNGLQINYLAENQYSTESDKISSIDSEMFLKMVYDDDRLIGTFPLVKMRIRKNHNQDNKPDYFILPVYVLKSLSAIFNNVHQENMTQVRDYIDKFGGKVIVYDE